MNTEEKNIETIQERLTYGIEFRVKAALPKNQLGAGTASFEVFVDEKVRYRINYSIENKAAFEDFQNAVSDATEEISVILKLTLGIIGHRVLSRTLRANEQALPNVKGIEHELHVPRVIDPKAHENPILSSLPLDTELLTRLTATVPRMQQYSELLLELYALKTTLDFTAFKEGFELFLPRVNEARKRAVAYSEKGDKAWPKRILQEFPEYRHNAYDLILRLTDAPSLIPEKLLLAINATGATFSSSSHITLEMIARVCGSDPYQYSIKHLEAIKAGKHPRSGKTRKRKHADSITRGETIELISDLLAG